MEQEQVGSPVPPLPSPPFRPSGTELGRLWGGWSAGLPLVVVSQVIGWGVEVGSLPPAGFLMLFLASVALE